MTIVNKGKWCPFAMDPIATCSALWIALSVLPRDPATEDAP